MPPGALRCIRCGFHLPVEADAISTSAQASPAEAISVYAKFWKRSAAMILDWLILWFPIAAVINAIDGVNFAGTDNSLYGLLLAWLYFAVMESSAKQATIGKMALGIKVTDIQGNRLSFGRGSARFFGKLVSAGALGVGFAMAAFTKRRQAFHDVMASCVVVNKAVTPNDLQQASPTAATSKGAIAVFIVAALVLIGILAADDVPFAVEG